jgi:PIN domain nuclease of toxin-antitoxin system
MKNILLFVATIGIFFATGSQAKNPYWQPNNSWISLSGTIDEVSRDSFKLDYGTGTVTVEMDDGDRDADGYKLLKGDNVTVSGKIDRDLYEKTKIEAGSVFVENLGTTFFASAVDEEDSSFYYSYTPHYGVPLGTTTLYGTVSNVDGRVLTLDTGYDQVSVDTKRMSFNPLDKKGYLQVKKGDRITVSGRMTENFFGSREFEANTLVSYSDRPNDSKGEKKTSH